MAKRQQTCVTYYRVSSGSQRERGSIARQDDLIPALVKQRDLRELDTYRDDGKSGRTIENRDGMTRLVNDLPKLKPDFIVFLRSDRYGRAEDWQTLMQMVNVAPQHKVNLLYLVEDAVTGELKAKDVPYNDPVALYTFQGEVLRAGQENLRRGRDSRMGNFSNLLRGIWPFGAMPFGWKWSGKERCFKPVPDQIELVRWMYSQIVDAGKGMPTIAHELRGRKVLLPKAQLSERHKARLKEKERGGEYRWIEGSVRQLIARGYYGTGVMRYNVAEKYPDLLKAYREGKTDQKDVLTPDGYVEFKLLASDGQPVVSAEVWQQCRDILTRRHRRRGGQRRRESKHFTFGPWLRCDCGGSYKAHTHKGKFRYYTCKNHASGAASEGRPFCSAPHLPADDIDGRLWTMLLDWISRPSLLLERWVADEREEAMDPDALRAEIAKKTSYRKSTVNRQDLQR